MFHRNQKNTGTEKSQAGRLPAWLSLSTDAATKIAIINRRLNPMDFERSILMEERWDGLDEYRQEANAILKRRAAESNNLVQEKYSPIWPDGKKHSRNVYAHSEAECEMLLAKMISEMRAEIAAEKELMKADSNCQSHPYQL